MTFGGRQRLVFQFDVLANSKSKSIKSNNGTDQFRVLDHRIVWTFNTNDLTYLPRNSSNFNTISLCIQMLSTNRNTSFTPYVRTVFWATPSILITMIKPLYSSYKIVNIAILKSLEADLTPLPPFPPLNLTYQNGTNNCIRFSWNVVQNYFKIVKLSPYWLGVRDGGLGLCCVGSYQQIQCQRQHTSWKCCVWVPPFWCGIQPGWNLKDKFLKICVHAIHKFYNDFCHFVRALQ